MHRGEVQLGEPRSTLKHWRQEQKNVRFGGGERGERRTKTDTAQGSASDACQSRKKGLCRVNAIKPAGKHVNVRRDVQGIPQTEMLISKGGKAGGGELIGEQSKGPVRAPRLPADTRTEHHAGRSSGAAQRRLVKPAGATVEEERPHAIAPKVLYKCRRGEQVGLWRRTHARKLPVVFRVLMISKR